MTEDILLNVQMITFSARISTNMDGIQHFGFTAQKDLILLNASDPNSAQLLKRQHIRIYFCTIRLVGYNTLRAVGLLYGTWGTPSILLT